MTVVRELIAFLGFDFDEQTADQADRSYENLKKAALGASAAVIGIGSALGIVSQEAAESAAELDLWSQRLGIGVERLSSLQFAADSARASGEKLLEGLADLGEKASDVFRNDPKGTSDAGESFKALGISVRDAAGQLKSVDQIFGEVLDKLPKIQNEGDRTGVAMRLLGDDAGRDLVPFLSLGRDAVEALAAEAGILGAVIGDDDVRASKRFGGGLARLSAQIKGIQRRVGFELLPTLSDYVDIANQVVKSNRELIRTRLEAWVGTLVRFVLVASDRFQSWARAFDRVFIETGFLVTALKVLGTVVGVYLTHQLGMLIAKHVLLSVIAVKSGAAMTLAFLKSISTGQGLRAVLATLNIQAFLLGAAFIAAALFLDDVITHIQGGNSIIGEFLDKLDPEKVGPDDHWIIRMLSKAVQLAESLTEVASDIYTVFSESDEIAGQAAGRLARLADDINGSFADALGSVGGFFTGDVNVSNSPTLQKVHGGLSSLERSAGIEPYTFVARPPPTLAAPSGPRVNQQVTANVAVHGAGTDPTSLDLIRRAARDGVEEAANRSARELEGVVVR